MLIEAKFDFTFLKSRLYKTGLFFFLSFSSKKHQLKFRREKEYILMLDISFVV